MSRTKFDLERAELPRGVVLLEASAGTGKTFTLVGILLRLLIQGELRSLDRALVVTFTVAATEELKDRLRKGLAAVYAADPDPAAAGLFARLAALPDAKRRCRDALDDFDRVAIATIHGFCKRVLDESAFESGQPFRLEFTTDPRPLQERAAGDALRRRYEAAAGPLSAILHHGKLDPVELVDLYRKWQRHEGVDLSPAAPDADAAVANVAAALQAVQDTLAGDGVERLCAVDFKATAPWRGQSPDAAQRLAADLATNRRWLTALRLVAFAGDDLVKQSRKKGPPPPEHPFFAACRAFAAALDDAVAHLRADLLQDMHKAVREQAQREQTLSFDDLLRRTAEALRDTRRGPALRDALQNRYDVALIDEFQDTDALQYEIFAECFAKRRLFLIGDPKQSIYAFRGADLSTYLDAADAADASFTLDVNFRSSDDLVRSVNALFAGPAAFVEPRITMPEVTANDRDNLLRLEGDDGPALRWRAWRQLPNRPNKAAVQSLIVADVAGEVRRLLAGHVRIERRPLRPGDVAVLVRSHHQADAVRAALLAAGVPAAIGKSGNVLASDEAEELDRVLHAVLEPRNLAVVRGGLATRIWGRDAAWLLQTATDESLLEDHLGQLEDLRRAWLRQGVVAMAAQLFAFAGTTRRLQGADGGDRALTNYRHVLELLHQAAHDERLGPDRLLDWLRRARSDRSMVESERTALRLESDADAVKIVTLHASKGLQYEVVFCPFLHGGVRSEPPLVVGERGRRVLRHELSAEEMHRARLDALAEDLRLTYVALTRAKRRCYVHLVGINTSQGNNFANALSWLLWRPPTPDAGLLDADVFAAWESACGGRLAEPLVSLPATAALRSWTMAVQEAGTDALPALPTAVAPAVERPRQPEHLPSPFRIASFSGMIAGDRADHDARDRDDIDVATAAGEPDAPAAGIFAFPRGTEAGSCLHDILERVNLQTLDDPATTTKIAESLQNYRIGAGEGLPDPAAAVLANLRNLAAARISPDGPTLAEVCSADAGRRAAEWEFFLGTGRYVLDGLLQLFERHGSDVAKQYAQRHAGRIGGPLRRQFQEQLTGFLKGSIDLVTEFDGKFWVIDWKSNHLGNRAEDYDQAALRRTMVDHHYVLQYHLYAIAVHRQLRQRRPDYAPERHFGGALYAFVRGATPAACHGIFVDAIRPALLLSMDEWLGGNP